MSADAAQNRKIAAQEKRAASAKAAHEKHGQTIVKLEQQQAKTQEKLDGIAGKLEAARAEAVQAQRVAGLEAEHLEALKRYHAGKAGGVAEGFVEPDPDAIPQSQAV
jgi:uncharacterized coiled-coil protein SlyX